MKELLEKAKELEMLIAEVRDSEKDSKELSSLHLALSELITSEGARD